MFISAIQTSNDSHSPINFATPSSSFFFFFVISMSFSASLPNFIICSSYSAIFTSAFAIISSIFFILFGALKASFLLRSCSAFSSGVNSAGGATSSHEPDADPAMS